MDYLLSEMTLKLPDVIEDRSVNVLLFGTKRPPDFNLVISRDYLPKGEKLDFIVKKQLDVISAAQKNFKQLGPVRERQVRKRDGSQVTAKESAVSYKDQGVKYFQRHLYIPQVGVKILIIVATVVNVWEKQDEATWDSVINSIRLA
ncbi:MAG: DcrB-related protein [Candidatus Thiodiazotropha sp.]